MSSNTRLSYFAIRDEIIVLKMDFIKAIINKEHFFIIKENVKPNSTPVFRNQYQITLENINQINQTIINKKKSSSVLKVSGLEAILFLIEQYFSKSVHLLLPEVNKILSDIYYPKNTSSNITLSRFNNNNDTNTIKFKNFLKIQKELIDLEFRVKEVFNIIEELEEDVEKLSEDEEDNKSGKFRLEDFEKIKINQNKLLIQSNISDENDELEEILGTYNNFISQILGEIQKYSKEMETTKEYVSMLMAQRRNDIAYMNIYSSVINLSISCCMMVSGFFGMNLRNDLETSMSAFIVVIVLSIIFAISIVILFHNYLKRFKN